MSVQRHPNEFSAEIEGCGQYRTKKKKKYDELTSVQRAIYLFFLNRELPSELHVVASQRQSRLLTGDNINGKIIPSRGPIYYASLQDVASTFRYFSPRPYLYPYVRFSKWRTRYGLF